MSSDTSNSLTDNEKAVQLSAVNSTSSPSAAKDNLDSEISLDSVKKKPVDHQLPISSEPPSYDAHRYFNEVALHLTVTNPILEEPTATSSTTVSLPANSNVKEQEPVEVQRSEPGSQADESSPPTLPHPAFPKSNLWPGGANRLIHPPFPGPDVLRMSANHGISLNRANAQQQLLDRTLDSRCDHIRTMQLNYMHEMVKRQRLRMPMTPQRLPNAPINLTKRARELPVKDQNLLVQSQQGTRPLNQSEHVNDLNVNMVKEVSYDAKTQIVDSKPEPTMDNACVPSKTRPAARSSAPDSRPIDRRKTPSQYPNTATTKHKKLPSVQSAGNNITQASADLQVKPPTTAFPCQIIFDPPLNTIRSKSSGTATFGSNVYEVERVNTSHNVSINSCPCSYDENTPVLKLPAISDMIAMCHFCVNYMCPYDRKGCNPLTSLRSLYAHIENFHSDVTGATELLEKLLMQIRTDAQRGK